MVSAPKRASRRVDGRDLTNGGARAAQSAVADLSRRVDSLLAADEATRAQLKVGRAATRHHACRPRHSRVRVALAPQESTMQAVEGTRENSTKMAQHTLHVVRTQCASPARAACPPVSSRELRAAGATTAEVAEIRQRLLESERRAAVRAHPRPPAAHAPP